MSSLYKHHDVFCYAQSSVKKRGLSYDDVYFEHINFVFVAVAHFMQGLNSLVNCLIFFHGKKEQKNISVCVIKIKETLLALVRDLFTFSSKVIKRFIIV
jgi:hypothetical protein